MDFGFRIVKKNAQHRTHSGPRTHSRYSAHGRSSGESLGALRRVKRAVWVLRDRSRLPREVAGNRLGDTRLTQAVCKRAAHGEGEGHAGEGGEDGGGPRGLLQEGGRHRAAGSTGEGAQERQRVRAERAEGGEAEDAESDTGGGLTAGVISEVTDWDLPRFGRVDAARTLCWS